MAKFKSVCLKPGKKENYGEVVMIPLDEPAFLEPICEQALHLGMLPDPENPESGYAEAWKAQREPEIIIKTPQMDADEVKGGCFKKSDVAAWEALKLRLTEKYKKLQKEDAKKRQRW